MITESKLLELGFELEELDNTLYSYELDNGYVGGTFRDDVIIVEVDVETQVIGFHYLDCDEKITKGEELIFIWFNTITTDEQLEQFINLLTPNKDE